MSTLSNYHDGNLNFIYLILNLYFSLSFHFLFTNVYLSEEPIVWTMY